MPKNKKFKVTLEDVGRWFDEYILSNGKEVYIEAEAKNLPREILRNAKISPAHARAVLEIFSEINPEKAEEIRKRGSVTPEEYKLILESI